MGRDPTGLAEAGPASVHLQEHLLDDVLGVGVLPDALRHEGAQTAVEFSPRGLGFVPAYRQPQPLGALTLVPQQSAFSDGWQQASCSFVPQQTAAAGGWSFVTGRRVSTSLGVVSAMAHLDLPAGRPCGPPSLLETELPSKGRTHAPTPRSPAASASS
jgi:hypothetical protein